MFLTDAELQELTGYRRPKDRCRWLDRWHIPYYQDRNGRPIVLRNDLGQTPHSLSRTTPSHGEEGRVVLLRHRRRA
jgi:hypothetical protein